MEYKEKNKIISASGSGGYPREEQTRDLLYQTPPLANVIYLFVSKNQKGIMLYDYTEGNSDEKIVSTSFKEVEWNEEINKNGERIQEVLYSGTRTNQTFIVSKEELESILMILKKAQKDEKHKTIINFNEILKKYNNIKKELQKIDNNINNFNLDEELNYNKHTK